MSYHNHKKKGFTLIETIVSLAVLSLSVAGPMTLAAHSIKASGAAKNELIATHLVEEGLEVVRNIRDNKSAEDTSDRVGPVNGYIWMQGIYDNCKTAPGCVIDITQHASPNVWNNATAIIPCPADCSTRAIIYRNPSTSLYRQSASALGSPWLNTQFTRTILMTGIDDPVTPERQVRVTVTVTYPGYGSIIRTMRVTQDVYNWFPEKLP